MEKTLEEAPDTGSAPAHQAFRVRQDFLWGELAVGKQSPHAENVSRQTSVGQQEGLQICCAHPAQHAWVLVPSESRCPQLCTFRPSCARDRRPTPYKMVQRCLAL